MFRIYAHIFTKFWRKSKIKLGKNSMTDLNSSVDYVWLTTSESLVESLKAVLKKWVPEWLLFVKGLTIP